MERAGPLILYVDDEHANRVVFDLTFGKSFEVKSVASAEEALVHLAQETVGVLVTDQRMAKMSGDELLRRAKEMSPDTVRMIVTAYSDLEPILAAVNEGLVARYVIKPWDRAELEESLRWGIEAYVAGRQNSALQLRLIQTERLRTLGQVSASILHDLNQPVMAISMSAEQLQELAKSSPLLERLAKMSGGSLTSHERAALAQLSEELPELASNLATCTTFMSELMTQMRQFQRRESEAGAPGEVEPVRVIKLALSMCRSGSVATGAKLTYDGPTELPRVVATSTDLMQIFVNLVRNAQQAIVEHRVKLGAIAIVARVEPGYTTFAVRDNGPGIPATVLAKLGTPFFTTREEGTGLGVNQCKRIVGRLGGHLKVESEEGSGTTVTFRLPVARVNP